MSKLMWCIRCHLELEEKAYTKNRKGEYKKTCNKCLDRMKQYYDKNMCKHMLYVYRCRECFNNKRKQEV